MKNQTAVEWLAEKYNYVTWMRNRDEISAGLADEWRKHYLEQAKQMESEQMQKSYTEGYEFARKELIYEIIDNYMPNERHNKV